MRKYNNAGILTLTLFLFIWLGFNLLLTALANHSFTKSYNVEVNRAYATLAEASEYSTPDLSDYDYIEQVSYLSSMEPPETTLSFFQNRDFTIVYPYYQNEILAGYIKFNLSPTERLYTRNIRVAVNLLMTVLLIFLSGILGLLKKQIITPFQRITDLPLALSKGTLTAPIPESKNRYFGKFIWGLNMLRETLEYHRQRELTLQKEKKTLILSISHDIKTPLNAIDLYTKALKENLYNGENKRLELLDNITRQSRDIEGFVNDIIKASKEDFLDIQVSAGEFYPAVLKNRLDEYYDDKLDLLKTEFSIDFKDNPLLFGDLDRTIEVLQNVMENAIKYGDGRFIRITGIGEEDRFLITVANSGCTLPIHELVHLFDSFFRGSNTKTQTGSGLGLYICRQILKRMDGEIFAEIQDDIMLITVVMKTA